MEFFHLLSDSKDLRSLFLLKSYMVIPMDKRKMNKIVLFIGLSKIRRYIIKQMEKRNILDGESLNKFLMVKFFLIFINI